MPPAAAVYVKVIVRPVWLAETFVVGVVSVPAPSDRKRRHERDQMGDPRGGGA